MKLKSAFLLVAGILMLLFTAAGCNQNKMNQGNPPQNTTFGQMLDMKSVTKITVTDGSTGEVRQTENSAVIQTLMKQLSDQELIKDATNSSRTGFSYSLDLYFRDANGYYRYTPGYGFSRSKDFTGSNPEADYREKKQDEVLKIISEFYSNL